MENAEFLCACKDELTNHMYVIEDYTGEEGYMCLSCATFKPFDEEGIFDEITHYNRMKSNSENESFFSEGADFMSNDNILFYIVPRKSFSADGRVFLRDKKYPVYGIDGFLVVYAENGLFNFANRLLSQVINEWGLEIVDA